MFKNLDKKQKIEILITGIGILFLIFFILGSIKNTNRKKITPVKAYNEIVAGSLAAPVSKILQYRPRESWGRDPFYPETSFGGISSNVSGFILNGIAWDAENPYAIINDEIAKVGDKISGMTVIEINEKSVVIEQDGQKHTLELNLY